MPDVPQDDGRGFIAHKMDFLFGCHWSQKVQAMYGYTDLAITAIGTSGVLWNQQIADLGFTSLSHHWLQIMTGCMLAQSVVRAVKSRAVSVPPKVTDKQQIP